MLGDDAASFLCSWCHLDLLYPENKSNVEKYFGLDSIMVKMSSILGSGNASLLVSLFTFLASMHGLGIGVPSGANFGTMVTGIPHGDCDLSMIPASSISSSWFFHHSRYCTG